MKKIEEMLVVVRSGGDIATGVIQKLVRTGFSVVVLEKERPLTIRRTVSLSTAMSKGTYTVEDMVGERVDMPSKEKIMEVIQKGHVPLIADENGVWIRELAPDVVVDAMIAKRNIGTSADMAPIVVALGPGFTAPKDAHVVIETMRGHNLGRLIFEGMALPNTGEPGVMGGESLRRVLRAPKDGFLKTHRKIGDIVHTGDVIFSVDGEPVVALFDGMLRGLMADGAEVREGLKTADIDPRISETSYLTISDKGRAIGGAVLEAVLIMRRKKSV